VQRAAGVAGPKRNRPVREKKKRVREESGPRGLDGDGFWGLGLLFFFFLFFSNPFQTNFQTFLNQIFYTFFTIVFHKLF
jgi:hypothetical protein